MRYARVIEDADQVAISHLADVGACGECFGTAGNHCGPDMLVVPGSLQRSSQFCQ
ncbi:hypothetical protein D3C80_1650390 [compost metagenome]